MTDRRQAPGAPLLLCLWTVFLAACNAARTPATVNATASPPPETRSAEAEMAESTPEEIAFLQQPPGTLRVMSFNPYWDAIFPDEIAGDGFMPRYDKAAAFRRIAAATAPDIFCLQEIAPARNPQQVAAILDAVLPLDDGRGWQAHRGEDSVIASRFDLALHHAALVIQGSGYSLGHAAALVDLPDTGGR